MVTLAASKIAVDNCVDTMRSCQGTMVHTPPSNSSATAKRKQVHTARMTLPKVSLCCCSTSLSEMQKLTWRRFSSCISSSAGPATHESMCTADGLDLHLVCHEMVHCSAADRSLMQVDMSVQCKPYGPSAWRCIHPVCLHASRKQANRRPSAGQPTGFMDCCLMLHAQVLAKGHPALLMSSRLDNTAARACDFGVWLQGERSGGGLAGV